jgi:hypothetical protein
MVQEGHSVELVVDEVDRWMKGKPNDGVAVHGSSVETFKTPCSVS